MPGTWAVLADLRATEVREQGNSCQGNVRTGKSNIFPPELHLLPRYAPTPDGREPLHQLTRAFGLLAAFPKFLC